MSALHCIRTHLPVLGGAAVYAAVLAHIEVALLVSEAVRPWLSVLFRVQLSFRSQFVMGSTYLRSMHFS